MKHYSLNKYVWNKLNRTWDCYFKGLCNGNSPEHVLTRFAAPSDEMHIDGFDMPVWVDKKTGHVYEVIAEA